MYIITCKIEKEKKKRHEKAKGTPSQARKGIKTR